MPLNEERYFARLTMDFENYKKDTIFLVKMRFENHLMIQIPDEKGDIHQIWILDCFAERL